MVHVDVVLVLTTVVFAILVIIASIYFLVYFQHPDDKWVAWFPKVIVVLGLSIACYNIFLLPLDVANQKGQLDAPGKIPMTQISIAFYIVTVIWCLVIVPFTVFFYEGSDEDDGDQKSTPSAFGYALKWLVPILVFSAGVIAALYWFSGYADVKATRLTGVLTPGSDMSFAASVAYCGRTTNVALTGFTQCYRQPGTIHASVSVLVYIVAIVSFVGWVLFSIFGGVGLVALPHDWVSQFLHRPKPITANEYKETKKEIGRNSVLLMEAGKTLNEELRAANRSGLSGRSWRRLKNRENEFRKDVIILELHYRTLEDCYRNQGGNFLLQLGLFIAGIIGSILSLVWFIHIILYLIPWALHQNPYHPFLNNFLNAVNDVPFVGTVFYALFSFYLLACVLKGVATLGMKVFFLPIHPLRVGESLMNSIVFNTGVVLICSMSVAQFCTLAFAKFARYTSNQSIFGVQMQNLRGIQYGYDAFIFILLGFAFLTGCYTLYRPRHKRRENRLSFQV
ncbi:LMBR1-like membrane protein [Fimicolochytrium jonesii]|uniref:LMBR1-like membrane protein n=1 Tax=Fimicolochytrium jonesii TaxID=1396493 RepID=UPI0022FE7176|nr:LMBR1-like membrane protein [Fimicolochytrium jonesii]KAI8818355.1 LMBR1-like membrane protein [Fimicolochytrium jonesii]